MNKCHHKELQYDKDDDEVYCYACGKTWEEKECTHEDVFVGNDERVHCEDCEVTWVMYVPPMPEYSNGCCDCAKDYL